MPDVPRHAEKAARIGVWVPWADTDSIGWLRYSLDQRKIPYTYLRDEDIRAGALRDRVDVAALRPRRSRTRRTDSRFAQGLGPDALQENAADAKLRHARGVRRHHRRHRMGRPGADSALRRRWRLARDPGQRLHASARRRHGARRSPVFGRRAAQHPGRRSRFRRGRAAGGHANSGCARARDLRST